VTTFAPDSARLAPGLHRQTMPFVKMEGLGNDFVIALEPELDEASLPELARAVCDRHFGVGGDGLVLLWPEPGGARLRIVNSDGSAVRNCGNALRCVASLLWARGEAELELALRIEGGVEAVATQRRVDGELWPVVRLDPPELAARLIPMILQPGMSAPVLEQPLRIGAEELKVSCLALGNPHCVLLVDELDRDRLLRLGPRIETAACFPDRANVELCRVDSRVRLEVLVWERGAGATLACGTGACAAAVVARLLGRTEATVRVGLPGGELEITWLGEGLPVFLAGPAREVFTGSFPLP
jgi:diaminopimelate epimerase